MVSLDLLDGFAVLANYELPELGGNVDLVKLEFFLNREKMK